MSRPGFQRRARALRIIGITGKGLPAEAVVSRSSLVTKGCISGAAALLLWVSSACAANVLSNQWVTFVGSHSDSAPALGEDGTIYFGTWKGKFWALNPNGSERWYFRTSSEIKSAPAISPDGVIYFGCRNRKLYALGPNGRKRWEFETGGWVDSSPALGQDGTIYFGSWDKNFYALNKDGTKKWQFTTPGEIVSSPAIGTDGTIYFGSHDRKLYALLPDGQKKWEFVTGGPIISSPALNGDQCLYITSVDGYLYAVNLDGKLRWQLHTGNITESSPVIGPDGTIYVAALAHLWAISPEGKKEWGRVGGDDAPMEVSPVVLANGSICYVGRNGLLGYAAPDGESRQMYYPCGCTYGSPTVGPNGEILVSDAGVAGAFTALRAGVALARSPWPKFRGNLRNTGNIRDAPR